MVDRAGSANRNNRGDSFLLALILLVVAACTHAQLPTATILGVVKDTSGAVVPEVTLTARNLENGLTRTALSGANGGYRFSALPVGVYELRAEHAGFKTEVRTGLSLSVSQEVVLNVALEIGAVEQTVAVTAEAPLVNTTSGALGGLVDQEKIADLPLNGRNYMDLSLMQTGVAQHKNRNPSAVTSGVWFSTNGAPLRSNNMLLDGAPIQNIFSAHSASVSGNTLGIDGIREYRMVTNGFGAEYGLTMGSQMVIVSRGGSNTFHGSLFDYLRNSALDARNFFDRKTAAATFRLPPFRRNNFGGSFGGPIQRDKLFFFAVYEGIRERLGVAQLNNVIPTAAKVDGGVVPVINSGIRPLLALFPEPNLPGNQYTYSFNQPTREDYGQIRVDHTFSGSDSIFGRYTADTNEQNVPLAYPQFQSQRTSTSYYGTFAEDHIFSPLLLNSLRFSFSNTDLQALSPSGIAGPQYSFVPGQEIGNISITGITTFGPDGITPIHHYQKILTWSDDLFHTHGNHSFKYGALINYFKQYVEASTNIRGNVNFPSLARFLTAEQPNSVQAATPGSILFREYRYKTLGFYAQDDIRLRSNLTLNLGLRYEFLTIPQEARGHGSALRDILKDAAATLGPQLLGKNPSLRNFSPRFGFAWDVRGDGRTSVRGAFGLLYDIGGFGGALTAATTGTPPFSNQSTVLLPAQFTIPFVFPASAAGRAVRILDYCHQQPHMLQYNLTVERRLPFDMALTLAYTGSRGINLPERKDGNVAPGQVVNGKLFWTGNEPRSNPNWTTNEYFTAGGNSWYNSLQVGLIKRLGKGLQFQSSYTYSKLIDETQGQTGGDNTGVPVDSVHRELDRGPAEFDLTHNWRLNAIYRLPKMNTSSLLDKVVNGWWMSGILSLQSGYPFSATLGSNRSRSKATPGSNYPDLLPGRNGRNVVSGTSAGCAGVVPGTKLGTPDLYFDPCAFSIQAAGFLGNAGRNILRGPGFSTLDFSLAKDTALGFLGEGGSLEFRAELFNVLNRANFSQPSGTVYAGVLNAETALISAGRPTRTVSTARQVQLSLRVRF